MEWSYSRRETLNQCPLKYYYSYYGSNKRTAKAEPRKEELIFLKHLANRHMRGGQILHLVLRQYFKTRNRGQSYELSRALSWAKLLFKEDLEYSLFVRDNRSLKEAKAVPLLEIFNDVVGAKDLHRESEQRFLALITRFFTAEEFEPFRKLATIEGTKAEHPISLKIGNVKLSGQIDLFLLKKPKLLIVDWKTSGTSGSESSLQLLFYALWAHHLHQIDPENISIKMIHLWDKTIQRFQCSTGELDRGRARILQDLERITVLESYGKAGVSRAFTPYAQEKVCNLCQYQSICPAENGGTQ